MSFQVSVVPTSTQNTIPDNIRRRSANYHPSIWGDHFLTCASNTTTIDTTTQQQHEGLKQEVKRMLMAATDEPTQKLRLIDAVQRLGVAYHFESDIEGALDKIHLDCNDYNDLYTTALQFRLLRQQGFNVSCDVFNKFKDNKGNFKESLVGDVLGMLELYEAAHLRVHGENILDEALAFTSTNLKSITSNLCYPLAAKVAHALKQPIRKGLPRVEDRRYCSIYEEDGSHNKALLKFAKVDFNILQSLHKKELSEISRWWKDLNFATKLSFARDRVVECYFWILGVYFEPEYSLARSIMTKVIAMTSVIDDIYDAYGTYEELESFTKAIERWDIRSIDQLPEYMKFCYKALLDVYEEMEEEMSREGKLYRIHYAKEAMKTTVQAYFIEAKWLHEDYTPTMEEYMSVALVSGAYRMLTTISFVGMGDIVTKEAFDWVSNDPKIVRASSIICRLMDDIVSHKFEQARGHVASAIECYMKQHNVTEQQVRDEFKKQIEDAWKDVNQECLRPTPAPAPLLMRTLNLARVIDYLYKEEDGYTHVGKNTKDGITSVLIDPVSI